MKRNIVITLASLLILAGCNNDKNQNVGFTIKGTLKGIPDGTVKLVTNNEDDRTSKTLDSVPFKNGAFELKGKIGAPQLVSLLIVPGNWAFQVFLEDTVLTVTADTTGSEHYDYTMYGGDKGAHVKNFTETGSKNFDDWMKYKNDPGQKQYESVFTELGKKIETTKDIDQQYKYRYQYDSVRKLLNKWQENQIKDYISKNPSSVAGVYMLRDLYNWYSDLPFDDMQNMVASFTGQAKDSKY